MIENKKFKMEAQNDIILSPDQCSSLTIGGPTYEVKSFMLGTIQDKTVNFHCFCGNALRKNRYVYKCPHDTCGFSINCGGLEFMMKNGIIKNLTTFNIPFCEQCKSVNLNCSINKEWKTYGRPYFQCRCITPLTVRFDDDVRLADNFNVEIIGDITPTTYKEARQSYNTASYKFI